MWVAAVWVAARRLLCERLLSLLSGWLLFFVSVCYVDGCCLGGCATASVCGWLCCELLLVSSCYVVTALRRFLCALIERLLHARWMPLLLGCLFITAVPAIELLYV